ncbi:acyl-CoA thioesterase [Roseibium litorale]|uniref:Acyl-[acyl-carrier-protein] thioesterase n=1 Tax=Roseibium litorale TaxID=2803841 RepID=A0ABR9CSX2_9HYPH|nr:thioesterase family protein [Roseibium litorale]MBD8893945.1 acyl-[acyl-carrier-protein] thioesterase [Roseibium litorale]
MPSQETLLSFASRWECDENNHLNTQFYFGIFEEADRQFQLLSGFSDVLAGQRRVRHVRFHKDVRCGDLVRVSTGVAFDGPHMLTVVHEMYNGATGELTATAIDGYAPSASSARTLRNRFMDFMIPMPTHAAPHEIPPTPVNSKMTQAALLTAGAILSHRATVLARHQGADNRADDQFAASCASCASPHVWERTPLKQAYREQNGLGRLTKEAKLTWLSPLKAGDAVLVISSLTAVQDKCFTLRHHLFESRTKRLAAICDSAVLALDLQLRQAVPLPEQTRRELTALCL